MTTHKYIYGQVPKHDLRQLCIRVTQTAKDRLFISRITIVTQSVLILVSRCGNSFGLLNNCCTNWKRFSHTNPAYPEVMPHTYCIHGYDAFWARKNASDDNEFGIGIRPIGINSCQHDRDRVWNSGQFSIPKDLIIFSGQAVKIWECSEKNPGWMVTLGGGGDDSVSSSSTVLSNCFASFHQRWLHFYSSRATILTS